MVMIMTSIIICGPTLLAQDQDQYCHLVGNKCEGTCGIWFWGTIQQGNQNELPVAAGIPHCHKVPIKPKYGHTKPDFECHCFLIATSTGCRENVCDESGCPDVYMSIIEAQLHINGIKGICIPQSTGDIPNCACKYEFPKRTD